MARENSAGPRDPWSETVCLRHSFLLFREISATWMTSPTQITSKPRQQMIARKRGLAKTTVIPAADIQADTQSRAAPLDILIETKF